MNPQAHCSAIRLDDLNEIVLKKKLTITPSSSRIIHFSFPLLTSIYIYIIQSLFDSITTLSRKCMIFRFLLFPSFRILKDLLAFHGLPRRSRRRISSLPIPIAKSRFDNGLSSPLQRVHVSTVDILRNYSDRRCFARFFFIVEHYSPVHSSRYQQSRTQLVLLFVHHVSVLNDSRPRFHYTLFSSGRANATLFHIVITR